MTGSAQGRLDGMPKRLVTVTPSRVDSWMSCPRRYRLTYVDRPKPPRGPTFAHQTVGAAAHDALLHYFGDFEPQDRRPSEAAELVRRAWPSPAAALTAGFRDETQSAHWREVVARWVGDYAAAAPADLRPRALERVVSFVSETARFEGRLDRVDVRGEQAVVVDYKAGRSVPTDADARASATLALYAVGVRRVLRVDCEQVELHHLPSGTVATAELDEVTVQRHLDRLVDAASEAEAAGRRLELDDVTVDEAFPTRPGGLCGWCDFRAVCPDGSAAAGPVERWAALAD